MAASRSRSTPVSFMPDLTPKQALTTVTVTFVHRDGRATEVSDRAGKSLMDFAVDHGVKGIEAQCGGAGICTTCLCNVHRDWFGELDEPGFDELEMLDYVAERTPYSRLSCQVVVTCMLHGLVVYV